MRVRYLGVAVMLLALMVGKLGAATTGQSRTTRSVERGRAQGEAPPTVTLLTSGTEPRKVLRLQPKAGDKQTVAFTARMTMDPWLTNLPLVSGTLEIKIKSVSANGVITCERVITDIRMPPAGGGTAQGEASVQQALSELNGVAASGVVSSRGYSRWTAVIRRNTDKQLPALARLFLSLLDMGLDRMTPPFPEQEVGAGAKWKVKQDPREGIEEVVYEITSIESRQLTAKATLTLAPPKEAPDNLVATGGGSGEITIDLGHVLPVKGNLAHRTEMSETVKPRGKVATIKTQMNIRFEAK